MATERRMRVLEFYSGIGGMHYALKVAEVLGDVVCAFDVNDVANRVYSLNFGAAPCPSDIRSLTIEKLQKFDADVFLMCPPCQPYTRLGKKMESKDPRASSFLHILELMPHIRKRPAYIALENVKGFEVSDTHDVLLQSLSSMGYTLREFLLSPKHYSIPNERTRYFLLAKLAPLQFSGPDFPPGEILSAIPFDEPPQRPTSIDSYLEHDFGEERLQKYRLGVELLARYGKLLDIVYSDSTSTCCFTKGYGHLIEGSGSVLDYTLTKPAQDVETPIEARTLRYFTPKEVSNLHHFPSDMQWPETYTDKQKYRLLGNSLNVLLVAKLLRFLFRQNEQAESHCAHTSESPRQKVQKTASD